MISGVIIVAGKERSRYQYIAENIGGVRIAICLLLVIPCRNSLKNKEIYNRRRKLSKLRTHAGLGIVYGCERRPQLGAGGESIP